MEDGFGLTTITALLPVITALTLCEEGGLSGFVLGNLVLLVLLALFALAERPAGLRNVDLDENSKIRLWSVLDPRKDAIVIAPAVLLLERSPGVQ